MGRYINVGKEVLFQQAEGNEVTTTRIADATSNEAAHAIAATMNDRSENYIRNALVTLSPSFFGEKVSRAHFLGRINGAIDALNKLDQVKKSLFYGRDNNLEPASGARDIAGLNERVGSGSDNGANIVHAIIGVATEAGELLEALRDDYNRDTANTMDTVNIREEVGDLFWYLAILAHEVDFSFEDAMRVNIAKLRKRYADKFDQVDANERDLDAEREILEGNGGDYAPLDIRPANPLNDAPRDIVDRANSISSNMVTAPVTRGNDGELHKSPAARNYPLHDEHIAQQQIRREDARREYPLNPDDD